MIKTSLTTTISLDSTTGELYTARIEKGKSLIIYINDIEFFFPDRTVLEALGELIQFLTEVRAAVKINLGEPHA